MVDDSQIVQNINQTRKVEIIQTNGAALVTHEKFFKGVLNSDKENLLIIVKGRENLDSLKAY